MSAIDFTMEIGRQPDPGGDRVKIDITRQIPQIQGLVTAAPLPPSRYPLFPKRMPSPLSHLAITIRPP